MYILGISFACWCCRCCLCWLGRVVSGELVPHQCSASPLLPWLRPWPCAGIFQAERSVEEVFQVGVVLQGFEAQPVRVTPAGDDITGCLFCCVFCPVYPAGSLDHPLIVLSDGVAILFHSLQCVDGQLAGPLLVADQRLLVPALHPHLPQQLAGRWGFRGSPG